MKVLLTGATGFIGQPLVTALAGRGEQCVVISRGGRSPWPALPVRMVRGDPTVAGAWQDEVATCDAVINLAGERLVNPPLRWTQARKRRLWTSRVATTERLAAALRAAPARRRIWLSGSAIGYYGGRGDEPVTEDAPAGRDFLARLCAEWEAAAWSARDVARVTLLRTGLVLGPGGGGLRLLFLVFRLGMGGPWGSGRQWWSWIHRADAVGLILYALDREIEGPLNVTAPNPVTVNELAAALGRAMHRPARLRIPAAVLRMALGEAADALLELQRVIPRRALDAGYRYRFPSLPEALADISAYGREAGSEKGEAGSAG